MAAFMFIQNIYIYDVSNKYTQHVKLEAQKAEPVSLTWYEQV